VIRRLLAALSLLGALLLASIAGTTSVSAASPPLTASASAQSLNGAGGIVALTLSSTQAGTCQIAVSPAASLSTSSTGCQGSVVTVLLPPNGSLAARSYVVSVRNGSTAATASLQLTVNPKRRVLFYGDSFGHEAAPYLSQSLLATGAVRVLTRTFPGTAMCSWLSSMPADAASFHPNSVILEFKGTQFVPCAQVGSWGSPAFLAAVRSVALQAAMIFLNAGAHHIYFVGAATPPPSFTLAATVIPEVTAAYAQVAAENLTLPIKVIDAGAAIEGAGGTYAATLPCLASELAAVPSLCTGGVVAGLASNVVRTPGEEHFCPVPWPNSYVLPPQGCVTYSSGAYRFGAAMAVPVLVQAHLGPIPVLTAP